jgi:hypothetical protein
MLAINTSMIPSEWDPLKWLQYAEATNVMFMDPTNEVLKGPLQGKSAITSCASNNFENTLSFNSCLSKSTFPKSKE